MQKMAQLAEGTSRKVAAISLNEIVSQRIRHLTRTTYSQTLLYLTLSDKSLAPGRSNAKVLKAPESRRHAYAGPIGTAKKKRKVVIVLEKVLASDFTTSRAGLEL